MRRWLLALALLTAGGSAGAAGAPHITVQVTGVDGALLKNVMAYLSVVTYQDATDLSESLVEHLHARAPEEIRRALQPFGYYDTPVDATLTPTADGWTASYVITLPPPVRIRHIDVVVGGAGRQEGIYDKFIQDLPYRVGDQLDQKTYEASKRGLQDLALQRGYLDARFTETRLAVNPEERWADISLKFVTGPRYYFGDVKFVQDFMDPAFLQRYVKFNPGDPFDNDALLKLQYALNDAGYFSTVSVDALRRAAGPDRRIPVRITLAPRKNSSYTLGLGYGTDTHARATLGWTDHRLNAEGHTFSAQTQISSIMETLLLAYTVPLSDPANDKLIYSLGNSRTIDGSVLVYSTLAGLSRAIIRGPWNDNQYLQFSHERDDIPATVDASGVIIAPATAVNSNLVMPGFAISRLDSDDLVLPTRGYRISLDLHGASNLLLSDTSFLQTRLFGKLITPLGESTTLLLRGELGASAVKSFSDLPTSQHFFAGGDQSVRGFAYDSIGVRVQGNNVGGKDLTVGSIELDHFFGPVFGVDTFIDTGSANNSFTLSLEKGVGGGLRWRTPVGMVRFDLAHPIKRPDLDRVRVHISLGPDL